MWITVVVGQLQALRPLGFGTQRPGQRSANVDRLIDPLTLTQTSHDHVVATRLLVDPSASVADGGSDHHRAPMIAAR